MSQGWAIFVVCSVVMALWSLGEIRTTLAKILEALKKEKEP